MKPALFGRHARRIARQLALATIAAAPAAHAASPLPAIVLVHGAELDGSSWRAVYDILTHDGFRVAVVQQPMTGLDEDVAATRRVIDLQDGPVVLVGQSYGGTIITVAGADDRVKGLVYVAALQPDAGETSAEAAPPKPGAGDDLRPSKDGFVFLDPAKFADDLCASLPKAQADFLAHSQMPVAGAVFGVRLPVAAWHDKPSYAIIGTEDHVLDPERARWMAHRAGSKITELKTCHAAHLAQPRAVARVIEEAARALK